MQLKLKAPDGVYSLVQNATKFIEFLGSRSAENEYGSEQIAAADRVYGAYRRGVPKDSFLRSCLLLLGGRAFALGPQILSFSWLNSPTPIFTASKTTLVL